MQAIGLSCTVIYQKFELPACESLSLVKEAYEDFEFASTKETFDWDNPENLGS